MVRIEKLEMQGFKSFAKKTVVTFPSNFSCITGPNGSGKSNILDSLVFVLGRTSAKSLRADKMLELIFHGSRSKPEAEVAKVSMFLDNSDRKFSIEEDIIIISRSVNRRGISIYKLNGKTVTRETVLEVLRAAHINPDGHNIILQGDVTEIIEMSPYERKEIIDEISGIREYDEKREKAQRELLTVEERLKEANIVINERTGNLQKLEVEWKAAQEYKKLTAELDKLRASLAKQKLDEAESTMKRIDDKISEKEKDLVKFDHELAKIEKEKEEVEKSRESLSKRLFDRAKDIEKIREIEKVRSDVRIKKGKIGTDKAEIIRLEDMIKRLEYLQQRETEGGFSKAVQEILKLGRTGIYGAVSSLIRTSPDNQIAIEVAAGSHFYDIVVSGEDVAVDCVNYLKKNRIGRATFLPLDKIRPRDFRNKNILDENGVVGLAIDLIKYDKKYERALSFIFGDTVVIDKIETAKRIGIGEARFVTLDGDLIERSGAIIGGYYHKKVSIEREEIRKYEELKSKLMNEIDSLEKEVGSLDKNLGKLTSEEELGSKQLMRLQQEMVELEQKSEHSKKKMKEFSENKINLQEEINKLRINKAKWEAALENVKAEFEHTRRIEATYKLAVSTLETKIRETESKINTLGPINFKALEEYDQQKKQYEELKEKVDTLTAERDKVLTIIVDIESMRKDTFEKTLQQLREQFKLVFKDLTSGEADLRLEGETLEESGLIIEASPAGKKLLNIDAMSGGEKTLVAMAFLFAIQRFRPAPFYILDEIDAALDKQNTKKIVELVKNYSKLAQFIIISHNDTTVAASDCVYGVTMEEGESKMVAIKMPE